ncbi:MAG TPA: TatD family hydrolase [Myxococcaceae bacterium]|nr:TatD family hydrolase [Myxococcaceae bacterium]
MSEAPPALFDAHLHPETLTDRDLESMRLFGVERALALAHHEPIESRAAQVRAHFDDLIQTQLPRLERHGIRAWAALGAHPQALPARGLPEILSVLPEYFRGGKVVALGEIGLHRGGEAEEEAFTEQLQLARRLKLSVVVHTPHRDKDAITRRALALLRDCGLPPNRVLVDHASATTLKGILACGYYAGLTIHPDELSAERAVKLIRSIGTERVVMNSDSGDGVGDILGLARAARLLERDELSAAVVARVTRENAERFLRVEAS